jgi:hypothetical protein
MMNFRSLARGICNIHRRTHELSLALSRGLSRIEARIALPARCDRMHFLQQSVALV